MQKLDITESLFGVIYPYIIDDNVTDIKWNGKTLWINDITKGRYVAKDERGNNLTIDEKWLSIFTTKIANSMNVNFNNSSPSMQAETDELRIHAVHRFVSGEEKYALAIRKTPSVSRLANKDLIKEKYVDEITNAIMPAMIRARMSGCVIGDVGAGKTELEKYLCGFIPETDGIITVEDTLEMKLPKLYPNKDIYSLKVTESYTSVDAIRDALRLLVKWLILSEARGREIVQVMEAASTGCCAMTSVHAENVWEIPDRMLNMAGDESREGFENDIYTFFDYAIKVKAQVTDHGIFRAVDQIAFFDRNDKENIICIFYKDGKLTGEQLPEHILDRLRIDKTFIDLYNEYFGTKVEVKEDRFAAVEVTPNKPINEALNEDQDINISISSEEVEAMTQEELDREEANSLFSFNGE